MNGFYDIILIQWSSTFETTENIHISFCESIEKNDKGLKGKQCFNPDLV